MNRRQLLTWNGFKYWFDREADEITIVETTNKAEDLVIPSEINEVPVTTIGRGGCQLLTAKTITIPSSVTTISDYAFFRCQKLQTVTFEDWSTLQSVGSYAFAGCPNLSTITFPDSVETGEEIFGTVDGVTAEPDPDEPDPDEPDPDEPDPDEPDPDEPEPGEQYEPVKGFVMTVSDVRPRGHIITLSGKKRSSLVIKADSVRPSTAGGFAISYNMRSLTGGKTVTVRGSEATISTTYSVDGFSDIGWVRIVSDSGVTQETRLVLYRTLDAITYDSDECEVDASGSVVMKRNVKIGEFINPKIHLTLDDIWNADTESDLSGLSLPEGTRLFPRNLYSFVSNRTDVIVPTPAGLLAVGTGTAIITAQTFVGSRQISIKVKVVEA